MIALLAALFVFVQALAFCHSSAHADEPHDHFGIACELTTVSSKSPFILPELPATGEISVTAGEPQKLVATPVLWTRPPGRAPPPRSPPSIQQ
tara:strand:+ start:181 stop:459 length:279 start_codon:yes stop_codon:yes gene_type:complete